MKPTATHKVATQRDLQLAKTYVAYRNAVLWPTRKLQRVITAAVVVAVGFMFQPGPVRYAVWTLAGVLLIWVVVGDAVAARLRVSGRMAKSHGVETYVFTHRGFYVESSEDADHQHPYSTVRSIHADSRYWILGLDSAETVMLARDGVDDGTTTADAFNRFLIARTGLPVAPLDTSFSATLRRAQEGRRGYLDSHPSKLAQIFDRRREHRD